MPVYILHGFRWPRAGLTGIRVYIILQNLDDAAAEYIQAPQTQASILGTFHKNHPEQMKHLPGLKLVEQYDPDDLESVNAVSQPYAFIADKVVTMGVGGVVAGTGGSDGTANSLPSLPSSPKRSTDATKATATNGASATTTNGTITAHGKNESNPTADGAVAPMLSRNLEDVISEGPGLSAAGWDALADLRDAISPGERIGWWVVYNGDPERGFPDMEDETLLSAGEEEYYNENGDEEGALSGEIDRDKELPPVPPMPPVPGNEEKKGGGGGGFAIGKKMDVVMERVKGGGNGAGANAQVCLIVFSLFEIESRV